ncbi:MAG: 23S rRNA (guanosine(2251)-2'-O)-methyltransferase RlmB [Gammaproteobacteria bacterium]|nr:23S rRNA (guanosine(2251)-2'-O)-methyltransferase RlmB [Gammaproteobacteria bacterium]
MKPAKEELIYGVHAVESALHNDAGNVLSAWLEYSRQDKRLQKIVDLLKENDISFEYVDKKSLDKTSKSTRHQGVVIRYKSAALYSEKELPQFLAKNNLFILILDGITDPHNFGACLRTADAVGVDCVIIPKDKAVGITPVVRKVASGAVDTVPVVQVTNLARSIKQCQAAGVWVYGAAGETEQTLYQTDLKGSTAIVMGAEEKGLRRLTRETCDVLIKIPMQGQVESLNVSVATAVILYEAVRQRMQ